MADIDKAIEHAKSVAKSHQCNNPECAKQHFQLAGWLRELKDFREKAAQNEIIDPRLMQLGLENSKATKREYNIIPLETYREIKRKRERKKLLEKIYKRADQIKW